MNSRRAILPLFLLFVVSVLSGQDGTFKATAPAVVRVGEQFQYVIEGSEQGDVLLPALGNFQLLAGPFSSYSSHSQWINGKMTMQTVVSYTHVLRATREGSFIIPAATVKVGRKEYRTNEVQVSVNSGNQPVPDPGTNPGTDPDSPGQGAPPAPENNPEIFLRVIPSKKEVFVGEQFVSGLKVYTRVNTRPASASKDIPYEGFYKKSLDPDANAQRQVIGGQQYISQVIQRHILIPQKTGEVLIEPYESEWMIPQRVQRRSSRSIFDDFFDDPFFNGVQEVPSSLATLPVTIQVKPLPQGAPEGFAGGVGSFSMTAGLSASEVAVNEALSLTVTISGTGNLPLLDVPEVKLPRDHDLYDVTRKVNTGTSGNRINGSVTFEFPIVARHAGNFRIAPVVFSWFDPETEQYRTTSTNEFNFTVLKGEVEEGTGAVYVPGVRQESVENLGMDIRDIARTTPVFTPIARSLMGSGIYRWAYPVLFLAALLLIILIRIVARRNADLKLVRNRQASKSARNRLRKADRFRKGGDTDGFYEEIGKAVWGYLSDKLAMETSGLSRETIVGEMDRREVPADLKEEFLRIIEESEFSRFAPSSEKSDVDQMYKEAAALIRNLENRL